MRAYRAIFGRVRNQAQLSTAFGLLRIMLMRATSFCNMLLTLLLLIPEIGFPQASPQKPTLAVKGYPGRAPVIQMNGKSYVEIESLARLTTGSLSFQGNQITLTLATLVVSPAPVPPDQPAKLSKELLKAGIEEMAVIGEWRTAVANAIRTSNPLPEDAIIAYRRNAESKLALAATAVVTDADRSVLLLLMNESRNMQKLSEKYLAHRKSLTYISPDSLDGDPLDQQIQSCAQGLASLTTSGQFQDVAACH